MSPEITFSPTPCSVKKRSVWAASARTRSASTTSAAGVSSAGSAASPSVADSSPSARASSSTRFPSAASVSAWSRACRWASPAGRARIISGAPNTQVPRPSATTADHLRAEENGTPPDARQVLSGNAAATADAVALASPARETSPSASPTSSSATPSGTTWSNTTSPCVSVPVLSRQTTSTRASPSTAGSSCTRVWRRARLTVASMNARLVSSTRPSGTMPTSAATVPVTASCQPSLSLLRNWLHSRIGPTTTSSTEIHRSNRFVPATSSERVTVKRRASAASLVAYASAPTAVAWNRPCPATTIEPDRTSSPIDLATGSDSPVSSDSSISKPADSCTSPSAGTWSPARRSSRSSATTPATSISASTPSRTTRARGAFRMARRSRVRLARSSWTMPIAEFATITPPNRPFCHWPVARMMTSNDSNRPLNTVKTLARTISRGVRLVGLSKALVRPAATRSSTSSAVSPLGGVRKVAKSAEGAVMTRRCAGRPRR